MEVPERSAAVPSGKEARVSVSGVRESLWAPLLRALVGGVLLDRVETE